VSNHLPPTPPNDLSSLLLGGHRWPRRDHPSSAACISLNPPPAPPGHSHSHLSPASARTSAPAAATTLVRPVYPSRLRVGFARWPGADCRLSTLFTYPHIAACLRGTRLTGVIATWSGGVRGHHPTATLGFCRGRPTARSRVGVWASVVWRGALAEVELAACPTRSTSLPRCTARSARFRDAWSTELRLARRISARRGQCTAAVAQRVLAHLATLPDDRPHADPYLSLPRFRLTPSPSGHELRGGLDDDGTPYHRALSSARRDGVARRLLGCPPPDIVSCLTHSGFAVD